MHDSAAVANERIARMEACAAVDFPFKWSHPYHIHMLPVWDMEQAEIVASFPMLLCWN